jgi:hypothetical protein
MFSKNLPEADYVWGCALYSIRLHLNRGFHKPWDEQVRRRSCACGPAPPCSGHQFAVARLGADSTFKLNGPPREIAGGGSSAARNRPARPLPDGALLRGVDYERRPEPLVRTLRM